MGDAELRASAAGGAPHPAAGCGERLWGEAQHRSEAAAGANPFLWELLLAEGLMPELQPCHIAAQPL